MPKKQTDVVTLSLKVGKSVLLGGLARLHMREVRLRVRVRVRVRA